jgi:hypothetical protein
VNIYSVTLAPSGITVHTRAGTTEAALRNALYWHGAPCRNTKSASFSVTCDGRAEVVRPLLWVPREIVGAALFNLAEITIERSTWDDDDRPEINVGDIYELQNKRRRSGIVVRMTADADYISRSVGSGNYDTPGDVVCMEIIHAEVVAEETLWPDEPDK